VNILVVGGGGREHALVWKIAQSPLVERIHCAPGNPGIARLAECHDIGVNDFDTLVALAREKNVGLVVVGPEDPLSRGIADRFAAEGINVFGPRATAAELEASKAFAKQLMTRKNIPTAAFEEFDDANRAVEYVRAHGVPLVVKANGLAAGKGVVVARDEEAAIDAIRSMMQDRVFGEAGGRVVIEDCLVGEEASILAFTDGRTVIPMVASQDHKPVFDGDQGPNTGGMGAYAPAPLITRDMLDEITRTVLQPCVDGMAEAGRPYSGVLYAGLMITSDGPKVIEFNCRFGDPETQVVLPLLESDLVPILLACCDGTLEQQRLEWSRGACVSVVMASGGYPGDYEKGKPITGIASAEQLEGVAVFHAGTRQAGSQTVTAGGRVLNVTASADSIPEAIDQAYRAVRCIAFDGAHSRTDIGQKAIARLKKA
jgi:phosphoribosylamine--glycine ligase